MSHCRCKAAEQSNATKQTDRKPQQPSKAFKQGRMLLTKTPVLTEPHQVVIQCTFDSEQPVMLKRSEVSKLDYVCVRDVVLSVVHEAVERSDAAEPADQKPCTN